MSGLQIRAFRPLGKNRTVNILTTAAAQTLAVPDVPYGTRALRVANVGTESTFIEFISPGGAPATLTTSMPLLGNTVEVFTLPNDVTAVSLIGTAGGNTVYLTYGEGL